MASSKSSARHVLERAHLDHARVVDQHVQAAVDAGLASNGPGDLMPVAHVARPGERLAAERPYLVERGGQFGPVAREQAEPRALHGQLPRDCQAQPARAAEDRDRLAVEADGPSRAPPSRRAIGHRPQSHCPACCRHRHAPRLSALVPSAVAPSRSCPMAASRRRMSSFRAGGRLVGVLVGMCGFGRLLVDAAFGQGREFLVGGLLFVQRRLQQSGRVDVPHRVGPGHQRAIGGHLVVFRALPGSDQARVHRGLVELLVHDRLALFDDPRDPVAVLAAHLLVQHPEDGLQAFDLCRVSSRWASKASRSSGELAALASFGSALVSCRSASYVSRSSSMNASCRVPASAMCFSPVQRVSDQRVSSRHAVSCHTGTSRAPPARRCLRPWPPDRRGGGHRWWLRRTTHGWRGIL